MHHLNEIQSRTHNNLELHANCNLQISAWSSYLAFFQSFCLFFSGQFGGRGSLFCNHMICANDQTVLYQYLQSELEHQRELYRQLQIQVMANQQLAAVPTVGDVSYTRMYFLSGMLLFCIRTCTYLQQLWSINYTSLRVNAYSVFPYHRSWIISACLI